MRVGCLEGWSHRYSAYISFDVPDPEFLIYQQIKHHLGPYVPIESVGFTSSEGWIAKIYDASRDVYKMATDDIFEYLNIDKPETIDNLRQSVSVTLHYLSFFLRCAALVGNRSWKALRTRSDDERRTVAIQAWGCH